MHIAAVAPAADIPAHLAAAAVATPVVAAAAAAAAAPAAAAAAAAPAVTAAAVVAPAVTAGAVPALMSLLFLLLMLHALLVYTTAVDDAGVKIEDSAAYLVRLSA